MSNRLNPQVTSMKAITLSLFLASAWPLWAAAPSGAPVAYAAEAESTATRQVGAPPVQNGEPYDQTPEIGPHHRRYIRINSFADASGQISLRTNQYISLASGLNYWRAGQWHESQELIEKSADGGAIAEKGLNQVKFAANINTPGAIQITLPNNKTLKNHPLGLVYYDSGSGQSVVIASLQSSVGEILPPNQIVYRNAFKGIQADLRFTYARAGLEADVILLENPKPPRDYGLKEEDCKLQMLTEFLEDPAPRKTVRVLKREDRPDKRQTMVEPDLIDETLDFEGQLQMIPGKCFHLEDSPAEDRFLGSEKEAPVAKRFLKVNGRDILSEAVEYPKLKRLLGKLPLTTARVERPSRESLEAALHDLSSLRLASSITGQVTVAQSSYRASRGVVLDYVTVSSASDLQFLSGTTYLVEGTVYLTGTTRFWGETVIKYNVSGDAFISVAGPIDCQTSAGSYARFTARDDDSVGENIDPGSHFPMGYYSRAYLLIYSDNQYTELHHLSMKHGTRGIYYYGYYPPPYMNLLNDCRFSDIDTVISAQEAKVSVFNISLCDCRCPFYQTSGSTLISSGMTIDCAGEPVVNPIIAPLYAHGDSYAGSIQVIMSTATEGATIRFSTDGSEPDASSPLYLGPINILVTTTLKAKAFKNSRPDSGVSTAIFTVSLNGGPISVAEAVDNTALTWITGPSSCWTGQLAASAYNGNAARSGPATENQASEMHAYVAGPGVLEFNWTASSMNYVGVYGCLTFSLDGVKQAGITNNVPWTHCSYSLTEEKIYHLVWQYGCNNSNALSGYEGWLDNVRFTPTKDGDVTTLGVALDNTSLDWRTSGNAVWNGQSFDYYFGGGSARCGNISHGQNSVLQTTLLGPGNYSFLWKVSSERGKDFLSFYVDSQHVISIDGESRWNTWEGSVGSGEHTLKWIYSKDSWGSEGWDCGWVDWFQWGVDDRDGDGMPDSWELQSFGNLNQSAGADYDGDGFNNLLEYQKGTNPSNPLSFPLIPDYTLPSGAALILFSPLRN